MKVAILGCGAIAKSMHLPATAASDQVQITLLADKHLPRAQELAELYGVPEVVEDYREAAGRADAAIVTLPSYLHAPATMTMLQSGMHVLVEKPMGVNVQQCNEMVEAARQFEQVLAVGLVRRFYDSSQLVRQIIQAGWLGEIQSFDCREGTIYSWAIESDSRFRKEVSGGGVLIDLGVHVLDCMLWWLGDHIGRMDTLEYRDDAQGGVEANCELRVGLRSGGSGTIELSRTRNLRNTWIICGERGTLEFGVDSNPTVRLRTGEQDLVLSGQALAAGAANGHRPSMRDIFRRQLDDFVTACLEHREPVTPGTDGQRVVELIETCYASRQPLAQPWMFPELLHTENWARSWRVPCQRYN